MRELALHVLDIVQNSLAAEARNVMVEIDEQPDEDHLTISITDDGRGMDQETVNRVLDPFVTTRLTRKVGLGLPLLLAAAQRCNGDLLINSSPGKGTKVTASFRYHHLDRAPVGDIAQTMASLITLNGSVDISYRHIFGTHGFSISTSDIRARIGNMPLNNPDVYCFIMDYLSENIAKLQEAESGS